MLEEPPSGAGPDRREWVGWRTLPGRCRDDHPLQTPCRGPPGPASLSSPPLYEVAGCRVLPLPRTHLAIPHPCTPTLYPPAVHHPGLPYYKDVQPV